MTFSKKVSSNQVKLLIKTKEESIQDKNLDALENLYFKFEKNYNFLLEYSNRLLSYTKTEYIKKSSEAQLILQLIKKEIEEIDEKIEKLEKTKENHQKNEFLNVFLRKISPKRENLSVLISKIQSSERNKSQSLGISVDSLQFQLFPNEISLGNSKNNEKLEVDVEIYEEIGIFEGRSKELKEIHILSSQVFDFSEKMKGNLDRQGLLGKVYPI